MMHTCLFSRLGESYVTLYWSLFGLVTLKDISIPNGQSFTSLIGMVLFMAFHFMAVIMLINMLIAMMSNSYQNIEVGYCSKLAIFDDVLAMFESLF